MPDRVASLRFVLPRLSYVAGWVAVWTLAAAAATAQQAASQASVELLAESLARPTGLALRPGGARSGPDLIVAEAGAGRLLGLSTDVPDARVEAVLTGLDEVGDPGWVCLEFRSRNRLLIGQTNEARRRAQVSELDIDDDLLPMSADSLTRVFDYQSDSGTLTLAGMSHDSSSLVVAGGEHGWLLKGRISSGPPGDLRPFIDTKTATGAGTPRAVTYSSKNYLVVAEAGSAAEQGDSVLVFYHPARIVDEPLLKVATGLDDIVALAYSPASGNLYAADAAWGDASRGGVYRLQASVKHGTSEGTCEAVLVARIARPSALVFSDDNELYVATLGDATTDGAGQLLKLTGDL